MKFKFLLAVYLSVLLVQCFALLTGNLSLQIISKPLLMPVLIFYFATQSKKLDSLKNLITAALVFSWLGDVILLIDRHYSKSFFVFGLLSFLVAHLFYIFYFWQIRKCNASQKIVKPFVIIGVLVYLTSFYIILLPYLSDQKISVLIYSTVIALLLLTSLHAFDLEKQTFGKICVAGTFLFAFSDSILAFNRFYVTFDLAPVFIMLTYSIAQLLIMEGSLQNLQEIEKDNNIHLTAETRRR